MSDNQAILIARAQNGDMEAFSEVFEPLRAATYSVACRLVGPNDADDVVMETYLKAWQALPKYNGRSSVKTWLYRITYNCAVDFLRSRRRRKENLFSDYESDGAAQMDVRDDKQLKPDELAARSELAGQIRSAITLLPPEHRVTLLLRFADDLSYSEIAAATGVSIGTVMSRLFNGKRKLRGMMGDMEQ